MLACTAVQGCPAAQEGYRITLPPTNSSTSQGMVTYMPPMRLTTCAAAIWTKRKLMIEAAYVQARLEMNKGVSQSMLHPQYPLE